MNNDNFLSARGENGDELKRNEILSIVYPVNPMVSSIYPASSLVHIYCKFGPKFTVLTLEFSYAFSWHSQCVTHPVLQNASGKENSGPVCSKDTIGL